jgi:DNA-binding GntR family transcriptional regulator
VIIDPDADAHPYEQLAAILRARIQAGEITSKLPSLTALMEESGLAITTVRRAIRLLEEEDLVYTRPGRGMFVKRETPGQD